MTVEGLVEVLTVSVIFSDFHGKATGTASLSGVTYKKLNSVQILEST